MQQFSVSAILLFDNHEETIGTAVARVAHHLRARGQEFELLAIDVGSHDNSTALLTLIRPQFPELRVSQTPPHGAHAYASQTARGQLLWFVTPDITTDALLGFDQASPRIDRRECDLLVRESMLVAHRQRTAKAFRGLRSQDRHAPAQLLQHARRLGLTVDAQRPASSARAPFRRWLQPLLSALSLDRAV